MTKLNHGFEDSSMLSSCDYDTETNEMTVTFATGRSYTYVGVDKTIYDDLVNAPSAGRYFNGIKSTLEIKK